MLVEGKIHALIYEGEHPLDVNLLASAICATFVGWQFMSAAFKGIIYGEKLKGVDAM